MKGICAGLLAILVCDLTGCDSGVYSATSEGDGTVVVVNRITGTILKVEGNKVVELHTTTVPPEVTPPKPEDFHPVFARATIAQQPVIVSGRAKYRAGNMLLLLYLNRSLA